MVSSTKGFFFYLFENLLCPEWYWYAISSSLASFEGSDSRRSENRPSDAQTGQWTERVLCGPRDVPILHESTAHEPARVWILGHIVPSS
eukprot:323038-Amphidinium_carterae.1